MQKRSAMDVVLIILIVLAAFAMSSCKSKNQESNPNTEYRTGSQGITTGFYADTPPKKVYAGSSLYIPVQIKNQGAYDDNPSSLGSVYLHGFDKTAMQFEESGDANFVKKELPPVSGKSPYLKDGGIDDSLTFEIKENGLKVPYGDKYEPTLMLSTCYRYRTLATPTVCIIPDPNLLIKNKLCEPKIITLVSQGAPVAVTKVEEEISKGMVSFMITVENIGGGNVIALGSIGECPFKLDKFDKINSVDITVAMKSAQLQSCLPSKTIRLINGKGTAFCRFAIATSESSSFTTPLNIQLDYGYNTNAKRILTIARVPGTPAEYLNNNAGSTPSTSTASSTGSTTSTGSAASGTGSSTSGGSSVYMEVNGQTCNPGGTVTVDLALGSQVMARVYGSGNVAYCGIDEREAASCPADYTVSYGQHTMRGLDSNGQPVVYENCNIEMAQVLH
jgi:hypothetical protein